MYSVDPLYEDAVIIVKESGKASEDLLMRRLRIGYARAKTLKPQIGSFVWQQMIDATDRMFK